MHTTKQRNTGFTEESPGKVPRKSWEILESQGQWISYGKDQPTDRCATSGPLLARIQDVASSMFKANDWRVHIMPGLFGLVVSRFEGPMISPGLSCASTMFREILLPRPAGFGFRFPHSARQGKLLFGDVDKNFVFFDHCLS